MQKRGEKGMEKYKKKMRPEERLAAFFQRKGEITRREKLAIVWQMSVPAIMAQITSIFMQYIDQAMVGSLGAQASASIGVVSTSTWLLSGLCSGAATGFSVQAAHQIGGRREVNARKILQHGLAASLCFSLILMIIGIALSSHLPVWLGAGEELWKDASGYFFVYACSLPAVQLNRLAGSMLQCSGNMRTPSILNASMCLLDIFFNMIFIRHYGVLGAAIGTALAELVVCVLMLWTVCFRFPVFRFRREKLGGIDKRILFNALHIGAPLAFEHVAVCGAMIATTRIIAPLGTVAIAANSFAVTAESFCYMPGYGIAEAATALVGQSLGAGKEKIAKSFSNLSVLLGGGIMAVTGAVMFFICPWVFQLMTPVFQVRQLAAEVLRIQLFAEPLYGVSIVASGALRGAGDTLVPSILNLISIWGVRLTLALLLVGRWGLHGVWTAMCIELCVRGLLLLFRQQTSILTRP